MSCNTLYKARRQKKRNLSPGFENSTEVNESTLTIERITDEQFADMAQAWQDLHAATVNASFFQNWHWNHAWWTSFKKNRTLCVLAFRDGHELVGLLPLYREKKMHWTGLTFAVLRFLGTEKVSSENLGFLCRPGFERTLVHEFVNYLELHKREWDIVQLHDFSDDSVFIGMLQAETTQRGFALMVDRAEICPYITLPSCTVAFYEKLSSNMRYNIRRRIRQLQNLGFKMEVVERLEEYGSAFQEAVRLHNLRWQMDSLPGNFRNEQVQTFHNELLSSKSRDWRPLFFFLTDGEQNIAVLYAFRFHDKLIYYQSGYDPVYAKSSPGMALMALVIEYAIDQKLKEFDFLRGDEAYKWQWTNDYRRTLSCCIYQPNVRCSVEVILKQVSNEIRRLLKRTLHALN